MKARRSEEKKEGGGMQPSKERAEVTWKTPCQLIGKTGWHLGIAPRDTAELLAEIRALALASPGEPVRMDAHEAEGEAWALARKKLLREGWGVGCRKHADHLRDAAGFGRFVFFPPGCEMPKVGDQEAEARAYYSEAEIVAVFWTTCHDYGFLWPEAETRLRQRAGRQAAVAAGSHKPKRPNAAGLNVDAPEVRQAYEARRKAKSLNTHNAAALSVAKSFGFTKGQVMRAAERGKWFAK